MAERLARTVSEIEPNPHNAFAVAVVLEVLGYTDQRAAEAGWGDVFGLARAVFERIEFLRILGPSRAGDTRPATAPAAPSPLVAVVTQQMVWLAMVVLMLAWGRSIWSAERMPGTLAGALTLGVLGSLVLSGGFHYGMARRIVFYISQRDAQHACRFLRWSLWVGGGAMLAGAGAAAGAVAWLRPGNALAVALAGGYFFFHGNYRLAVVPLVALNDLAGIALTTGIGVAALVGANAVLTALGIGAGLAVPGSQLAALALLWLASVVRTRDLLRTSAENRTTAKAGGPAAVRMRWRVIARDAAPWFGTGLLYYLLLFVMRPVVWLLPPAQRQAYEAGVDMGLVGIVPVAIAASWALHRYHQALRGLLAAEPAGRATALRQDAGKRFARTLWQCRWFGIGVALVLLALVRAPWPGMSPQVFPIFRLTLVGIALVLPGFLFSFGFLTSVGALADAAGVLGAGLALQVMGGLAVSRLGSAEWLALVLVASGAALSELAGWRALYVVSEIDRFYYAAF